MGMLSKFHKVIWFLNLFLVMCIPVTTIFSMNWNRGFWDGSGVPDGWKVGNSAMYNPFTWAYSSLDADRTECMNAFYSEFFMQGLKEQLNWDGSNTGTVTTPGWGYDANSQYAQTVSKAGDVLRSSCASAKSDPSEFPLMGNTIIMIWWNFFIISFIIWNCVFMLFVQVVAVKCFKVEEEINWTNVFTLNRVETEYPSQKGASKFVSSKKNDGVGAISEMKVMRYA